MLDDYLCWCVCLFLFVFMSLQRESSRPSFIVDILFSAHWKESLLTFTLICLAEQMMLFKSMYKWETMRCYSTVTIMIIIKEMIDFFLVLIWDSAQTNWLCGWSESVHELTKQESLKRLSWWDVNILTLCRLLLNTWTQDVCFGYRHSFVHRYNGHTVRIRQIQKSQSKSGKTLIQKWHFHREEIQRKLTNAT